MGIFGGALGGARWQPAPARTDAELLSAHVGGDQYAFEELFNRYHRQLYRLAHLTSRDPEDAADALQDAMLSAHRTAHAFRHDSAVSSWLYRIVVNAALDRLRRNKSHLCEELDDELVTSTDRTAQVVTAIVVERALMRLPAEQRAAVVAVDMQGYSVSEAARLLGVPEGTVKSRCSRARTKLAESLRCFSADAALADRGSDSLERSGSGTISASAISGHRRERRGGGHPGIRPGPCLGQPHTAGRPRRSTR